MPDEKDPAKPEKKETDKKPMHPAILHVEAWTKKLESLRTAATPQEGSGGPRELLTLALKGLRGVRDLKPAEEGIHKEIFLKVLPVVERAEDYTQDALRPAFWDGDGALDRRHGTKAFTRAERAAAALGLLLQRLRHVHITRAEKEVFIMGFITGNPGGPLKPKQWHFKIPTVPPEDRPALETALEKLASEFVRLAESLLANVFGALAEVNARLSEIVESTLKDHPQGDRLRRVHFKRARNLNLEAEIAEAPDVMRKRELAWEAFHKALGKAKAALETKSSDDRAKDLIGRAGAFADSGRPDLGLELLDQVEGLSGLSEEIAEAGRAERRRILAA